MINRRFERDPNLLSEAQLRGSFHFQQPGQARIASNGQLSPRTMSTDAGDRIRIWYRSTDDFGIGVCGPRHTRCAQELWLPSQLSRGNSIGKLRDRRRLEDAIRQQLTDLLMIMA